MSTDTHKLHSCESNDVADASYASKTEVDNDDNERMLATTINKAFIDITLCPSIAMPLVALVLVG